MKKTPNSKNTKKTAKTSKAVKVSDKASANSGAVMTVKKKRMIILGVSLLALAALTLSVLAIVMPLVKINSGFRDIFERAGAMDAPRMIFTDMLADNVLSGEATEVMLDDPVKTKEMADSFCRIAEKMKYHEKNTKEHSSWDLRVMIREGDEILIFYMAPDRMYYSSGEVKYQFVPRDDDTLREYEKLFLKVKELIKAEQQNDGQ